MRYAKELSAVIGAEVVLKIDSLAVRVRILDTRQVWGREDALVEPLAGEGQQWVSFDRLRPIQGESNTRSLTTV